MRILLADDHELVRDTIRAFLQSEPDIAVEAVADLDAAHALIKSDGPFDLVLLDYSMPGMNGVESISETNALNGGKPVGMISGTANRDVAEQALAEGSAGFLPKTISASSLVNAVRFMVAGEQYVPIKFLNEKTTAESNSLKRNLTTREVEVLGGLVRGFSNKEIARELDLQEVTIKLHVKTLCRKLIARNRTHAAMIAKEENIA